MLQRSGYLVGAILLHLIAFLLIATLVIWKAPAPPPTDVFHGVAIKPPPPPPPQPPTSGSQASNPQFEPEPVVVPVVTPPSVITTLNENFKINTPKVLDQTIDHLPTVTPQGTGLAPSGGGLNGSSGVGEMTAYGASGADGLVGAFYDLKQTPNGEPTEIAESAWEKSNSPDDCAPNWADQPNTKKQLEVLRDFVNSWNASALEKYYKADESLSLDQICIHEGPSSLATKAFHVEDKVVARRWIAIYSAKVLPPESGTYRFIGSADDFLVVNLDNRNVLDACNPGQILDPAARTNEDVGPAWPGYSFYAGRWIDMEQDTPINIRILIGEGPGGSSGFVLMIQKKGDNSAKGDYPIFQVQDVPVPDMDIPNFSKKKMLFQLTQ